VPTLPGNRLNDLYGNALGRLAMASGATRTLLAGGVVVYEACAGPVGWFIRRINGGREAAVTVGHVVLFTLRFDLSSPADRWLLAHERAHVSQAEALGILFLPTYSLGLVPAAALWFWHRLRGRRRPLHDLHPMEVAANRVANVAVPEAARNT
jgi:hypothetical protein